MIIFCGIVRAQSIKHFCMKKLVDREIQLDPLPWKDTAYLLAAFQMKAVFEGWPDTDIELVSNQIKNEHVEDPYHILLMYCSPPVDNGVALTMSDVHFLLAHLSMETHYLGQKTIDSWDEYDWSNYMMLKRRATRSIKRVYGLFSANVEPEMKYAITKPPAYFFNSYQEAQESIPVEEKSLTRIYPVWISV